MTMLYSPSDIPTSSSRDAVSSGVQAMYGTTYADMVERLFCKYECVLSLVTSCATAGTTWLARPPVRYRS